MKTYFYYVFIAIMACLLSSCKVYDLERKDLKNSFKIAANYNEVWEAVVDVVSEDANEVTNIEKVQSTGNFEAIIRDRVLQKIADNR